MLRTLALLPLLPALLLGACRSSVSVDGAAGRVEARRTCSDTTLPGVAIGNSPASHCEERQLGDRATRGNPAFSSRNGSVTALGAERGTVALTAFVYATAATEERAQQIVSQVVIHTADEDYHATGPRQAEGESWGVSFDAQMPRRSGLRARSTNGDLALSGVSGRIEFRTENGSAALSDMGGSIRGETGNGAVTIALGGTHWDGSGIEVYAVNGDVSFEAPEPYSAQFRLRATNGSTGSDHPGGSGSQDSPTQSSFEQSLGNGGATLRGEAVNGDAWVRRRD